MIGLLCALLLLGQDLSNTKDSVTVSGEIRSADGTPARAVRVTAIPIEDPSSFASIAETDASGRYRLENIPRGRYYVAAGIVEQPTYYPGATDVASASVLTLTFGGSRDQ